MKDIKLLYNRNMFVNNVIVHECLYNTTYNANTIIWFKLSFYRELCIINLIENHINDSFCQVYPGTLDMEDTSLVVYHHTLSKFKPH